MIEKSTEIEFGNNQIIGFYCDYAIVYDLENEQLYYFESPPLESMIGSCAEVKLLNPVSDLPENVQEVIYQEFVRGE